MVLSEYFNSRDPNQLPGVSCCRQIMFIPTGAFSLTKHFRDKENDDSADKTSAGEHVYQRVSCGGKNGWH
jgi:hypothetical protein